MKYVKLFEQFTQLNENAETVDGIPSELFTAAKKAQLGKRVIGGGIEKKRNPEFFMSDDEYSSLPLLVNVLEPVLKSVGLYNRKGVTIKSPEKPIDSIGSLKITLGEFIELDISVFYGPGSMKFEIRNIPSRKIIKKVDGWGKYEDMIAALESIFRSNIPVWDAALSQSASSTADKHLDDQQNRWIYKDYRKMGYQRMDQITGLLLTKSLLESPGNNRKKAIQDAINTLQAHLKDKSFTDTDVSVRIQKNDFDIKDPDGNKYKM